ncbi:MAG: hypothetical protein V3T33_00280 [Myxococcota bacterium]
MNRLYNALPVFAQNLGLSLVGYWRARSRYTPYFHQTLASWEKNLALPLSDLQRIQRQKLDALVRRARVHVPHYRALPPPSEHPNDALAIEQTLASIPSLDKETYRDEFQNLRARDIPTHRLTRLYTSGTTGTALPIYHTAERLAENYAAVWRQRRACGVDVKDPYLAFGGRMIVPTRQAKPPFWRRDRAGQQTFFSVYHLSTSNLPSYIDAIHAIPARYIQGYPSALHIVARAMLDAGRALPRGRIQAVFTSSETLLAFQSEVIEKAFAAPVRDHYAATELAVAMTACPQSRLHVDMEFCIVEVEVEEETDDYVRGPLVVTALGYDGTPFLRYRIGDVGVRSKHPCPCGRAGEIFLEIDGRIDDYVVTPDGRMVGRLDHVFKEQFDVAEAQILQATPEEITILIVPRSTYSEASQRKLLAELRARLGSELDMNVRLTEAIPREENGKLRAVKSTIGRIR